MLLLHRLSWVFAAASFLALPPANADAGPRIGSRLGSAFVATPSPEAASAAATASLRAGLIFSNFDKPPIAFQGGGFGIMGPANPMGYGKQFVGVPFAAKSDTSVTGIALPVNHQAGASVQLGVRVSLAADANGIPGATIASWPVATVSDWMDANLSYVGINLPRGSGVHITAGATYWIVVDTDAASDFTGWWGYMTGHRTSGTVAYWNDFGSGWVTVTSAVPALAVYGSAR